MRCPGCGAENQPGKRFCTQCGTMLPKACPSCGSACEAGQKFCGDCGASLRVPVRSTTIETSPALATVSHDAAERRQVTVIFVDLVGSTTMSARLDPEDLREVLASYHQLIAEVVKNHGGHVAQYLGD